MRQAGLFLAFLLVAGCADPERRGFSTVPDGDDDDAVFGDDDDTTATGDDDTAADDDDAVDPCGPYTVSAESPPVIEHGGDLGTIAWLFPAGCSTSEDLRELFGGWVDLSGNGLDVSATLPGVQTMADAPGRAFAVGEVEPFVAELDLGTKRYLPPPGLGGVFVSTLVDGQSWQACFYGHTGTWTEEGGTATVQVPDPLQFVCEE